MFVSLENIFFNEKIGDFISIYIFSLTFSIIQDVYVYTFIHYYIKREKRNENHWVLLFVQECIIVIHSCTTRLLYFLTMNFPAIFILWALFKSVFNNIKTFKTCSVRNVIWEPLAV